MPRLLLLLLLLQQACSAARGRGWGEPVVEAYGQKGSASPKQRRDRRDLTRCCGASESTGAAGHTCANPGQTPWASTALQSMVAMVTPWAQTAVQPILIDAVCYM